MNTNTIKLMAGLAALCFMGAEATATAQSEWYSNQSQPQDQSSWRSNFQGNDSRQNHFASSGSSDLSRSSSERTIRGRIQAFREATVNEGQGQRQEHALVKLRTQDGRTVVADLGPKQDIEDLDLQKGDRLSLRGTQGTVDGQSVFFASRIRAGDETVRVTRSGNSDGREHFEDQASNSSQPSEPFTLRGRVAGYQVITMESGRRQVSMLNLALQDGRSVLIDAGSNPRELDLKDLDLHDQAIIHGHTRYLNGHEVLVADNVQFIPPEQDQHGAVGGSGQNERSSGGGSSFGQNQGGPDRTGQSQR